MGRRKTSKKIVKGTRKTTKKILKRLEKIFPKRYEDFFEEAGDFFEDLFDDNRVNIKHLRKINFYGTQIMVRPAYIFAEKIENLLKIIFGISIFVSGLLATFWGFTRTSELLETLIQSLWGRIFIVIIGFSYFVLGFYKLTHIKR